MIVHNDGIGADIAMAKRVAAGEQTMTDDALIDARRIADASMECIDV